MRKKLLLAGILLTMLQGAWGQVFRSVKVEPVPGSGQGDVRTAAISPDGRYAFVTSMTNRGLTRICLADGKQTVLTTDEGAGLQPSISADGLQVMHRSVTFDEEHLRWTSLELIDLSTDSHQQLLEPSRTLDHFAFDGGTAVTMEGRKLTRRRVGARRAESVPMVSVTDDLKLMLTEGDETTILTPNGDDEDVHYLWASLSSDGKHILYYVGGEGAYVCDTQGDEVQFISSNCRAPRWYNNRVIIGMDDRDDGYRFTSSSIKAFTLEGDVQVLSEPAQMLMYPQCSAQGCCIVAASARGETYIIRVEE